MKLLLACVGISLFSLSGWAADGVRPNIVLLLADDMGYGEVQHLNPTRGQLRTPHLDALAQSGMVFTDAHSCSSVCTPTRYGLLTGRYSWRTRLQQGVLTGGRSLIDRDRLTLAKLLSQEGYHTGIIGKWHLGMLFDGVKNEGPDVPVGANVSHGPLDRGGFDEFFGFHHSRQMRLLMENDRVIEQIEPVALLDFEMPADAAVDSFSFLPLLRQEDRSPRKDVIHHSIAGHFAIRQGRWKLLLCPGSGGWSDPRPTKANWKEASQQGLPLVQLYDMVANPAEQNNLALQMPEKVAQLRALLASQVAAGRSNPGPRQTNAEPIDLIKDPRR